ncbi:pre-mRNA-splicing factor 8 [Ceratobasidium sp. 392]|nr:pre-mRNA-splicing factor 8 [Ceratobasidium sp. 392]
MTVTWVITPPLDYGNNILDVEPLEAIRLDLDEEEDSPIFMWFYDHYSLVDTPFVSGEAYKFWSLDLPIMANLYCITHTLLSDYSYSNTPYLFDKSSSPQKLLTWQFLVFSAQNASASSARTPIQHVAVDPATTARALHCDILMRYVGGGVGHFQQDIGNTWAKPKKTDGEESNSKASEVGKPDDIMHPLDIDDQHTGDDEEGLDPAGDDSSDKLDEAEESDSGGAASLVEGYDLNKDWDDMYEF